MNPSDLQILENSTLIGFSMLGEFYGLDPMAQKDSVYTE